MTTEELFSKIAATLRATIAYTPAPGCPACEASRVHTREELRDPNFHPFSGHGFLKEHGWTNQKLEGER